MNLVSVLWHLQILDQEWDEKTKRARQIDEALASDPVLSTARATLDTEQKKLDALRKSLHDRELEAKSLDAKIKEIETRLYSGKVLNPKELDGLDKDLQMHRRQRSTLDDKLLELMDSLEHLQASVDEKTKSFKQTESMRAGDVERLTHERENIDARLAELNTRREQTRASITPSALRTYDQLRRTKAGRAVAQLRRDSCGACGVNVPSGLINRVRLGEELVLCPSCGRILAM